MLFFAFHLPHFLLLAHSPPPLHLFIIIITLLYLYYTNSKPPLQHVAKLDDELKVKTADYNSINHTIAAEERKLGYLFLTLTTYAALFHALTPC
jgi:hypothetical protein